MAQPGPNVLTPTVTILSGVLVGVFLAVTLLDIIGIEAGLARAGFVLLVGIVGGVAGWVFALVQESQEEERPPRRSEALDAVDDAIEDEDDDASVGSTTLSFRAVGLRTSSGESRTLRVRGLTAPFAPPSLEVRLIFEEYDASYRIPVLEGVLTRMGALEVVERVRSEVVAKCPKKVADAQFRLVAYRSEGPLDAEGRCELGWSFLFVDGALGLACAATSTATDLSLHFHTVSSFADPQRDALADPADVLAVLREEVPEALELPIYARFQMPDDLLLYVRDPLLIADVDLENRVVRNAEGFRRMLRDAPDSCAERFTLAGLDAWLRGEPAAAEDTFLSAALAEPDFADALRTMVEAVVGRVAAGLLVGEGPGLVAELERRIIEAEDASDALLWLHVLAHVPSGLAHASLQRLAATSPAGLRTAAEDLFRRRRHGKMDVPPDPLDSFSWASLREAMGKGGVVPIALPALFNVEEELLPRLAQQGLHATRLHRLAGERPLTIGAHLRPARGETEALLTSHPLPVPCHILHLVGPTCETFSSRLRSTQLCYEREEMQAHAAGTRPQDVFRAALYLAALRQPADDEGAGLIAAYRRGGTDRNLRRAVLAALEHTPSEIVDAFLDEVSRSEVRPRDAGLARGILERRQRGVGSAAKIGDAQPQGTLRTGQHEHLP